MWAVPRSNVRLQASVKVQLRKRAKVGNKLGLTCYIAHNCKLELPIKSKTLLDKCRYIQETRVHRTQILYSAELSLQKK